MLSFYHPLHFAGGQERVSEDWAQAGVWSDIPGTSGECGHTAPFPPRLAARMIRLYSRAGDIVVDPFIGSGTTLIAAHRLERHCFGMDLSQHYIDMGLARWESETGETAIRLDRGAMD
jgi:site-specific DNA-methyltransferase (adenine-specific)